ncbi:uncharacterized protein LOC131803404 [Musca domestica]|uniref:Uncharacterized protein LOC131803404 n=1 Tax=Musca domestica TaxID=7370 RepID=A0ABM3V4G0_MUSDO|nr:uncharacterized protein LOC131803404 [Musca domestica]
MDKGNVSSLPKCRICHERHFIKSCLTFQNMSVTKRRHEARQKGFCFNCLCTAHTREWCPSRKTCMVCHKGHHTLLHIDAKPNNHSSSKSTPKNRSSSRSCSLEPPTAKNQQSRPAKQQNRPSAHTSKRSTSTSTQRRHSNVSDRLSSRTKSHVFLPTVLAKVITVEGCDKVRLLMNSGSTQTAISTKLVERLQLPLTQRAGKTFTAINLQSFHDESVKIHITGEVQNPLHISTPESTKDKKHLSIYNHLTDLADPHFFNPINIEIMIANDQIPKILRAGLIQTTTNMPIAQSSAFGWIISGSCQV